MEPYVELQGRIGFCERLRNDFLNQKRVVIMHGYKQVPTRPQNQTRYRGADLRALRPHAP